ncbi:helix-turn-helix domain-containing protein [Gluconobacter sp. LMG 31484]|uniref:Helix-turn-helix domain-containing protein n=1 Tax=Gluconobacter vitians TaxID=2728102 RepID=A0ABR9Y306_9PROT|nr:helix-turn-helix domain-containing protein [Gluconobacter vitians]MBF0858185.1 helix-turn-helix domain-containing protein [Gluconobacter vitians]
MSAAVRPIRASLLDVIAREFKPYRFAQEMLARASNKTPRTAKNWLSGSSAPDIEALIELMASCNSIADEVERLVAERRKAREDTQCPGSPLS